MEQKRMTSDEVGKLGEALYARSVRHEVETASNIGRMVIIDVETGDYEVDNLGLEAARHLQAKHPDAHLYGKRIGFDVTEAIGNVIERVA